MVRSGLVIAWRLATSPTRTSSDLEKATTEGVVRAPSALGITVGSPASRTLTTELVVPRSMPTALGMGEASWTGAGTRYNTGAPGTFPAACVQRSKLECDMLRKVSPGGREAPGLRS